MFIVWYDPTDLKKIWKIVETNCVNKLGAFSPNVNEFIEYCNLLGVKITGIIPMNIKRLVSTR